MKLKNKNIDEVVKLLSKQMYHRRYDGNDKIFCGGFKRIDSDKNYEEIIRKYLLEGYDVRTGYTCTRIRGYRNYRIFVKHK